MDHDRRRRELADAACVVVARAGVDGASLRLVAEQAGWSIGSMRHYFQTRNDLLAFALRRVGERIEQRITLLTPDATPLAHLRAVVVELLPLDAPRREESLVWLAFTARAAVDAGLAPRAEAVWLQIHDPLAAHVNAAIDHGQLPDHLDPAQEASRLQALMDGLVIHLLTVPGTTSAEHALALIDDHLNALQAAVPGPD